jgi:hypothetical protein
MMNEKVGEAVLAVGAEEEPPNNPPLRPEQDENDPTFAHLPSDLLPNIFGFLDVKSLCRASQVSRTFRIQSDAAMEAKKNSNAGVFRTSAELKTAVKKFYYCKDLIYKQELAEEIARDYGWIMNKWDISGIAQLEKVYFVLWLADYSQDPGLMKCVKRESGRLIFEFRLD